MTRMSKRVGAVGAVLRRGAQVRRDVAGTYLAGHVCAILDDNQRVEVRVVRCPRSLCKPSDNKEDGEEETLHEERRGPFSIQKKVKSNFSSLQVFSSCPMSNKDLQGKSFTEDYLRR